MMVYNRLITIIFLFTSFFLPAFAAQDPHVVLETNVGNIVLELYPEDAPITVDNFLNYVNTGFYDGLLFHRVIEGFMLQTGMYFYYQDEFYYRIPGDPIVNESYNGLSNLRGTVAMARLGNDYFGNPQPNTATSQFFINHVDNLFLDRENASDGYGYCVFGKVIKGMDVVDTIAGLPVVQNEFSEAFPNDPMVEMYRAYMIDCQDSYCADLTGSGRIGFDDFAIFASKWLTDCDTYNVFCDGSDLDYDGAVDFVDMEMFMEHWRQPAGYEVEFSDLDDSEDINLDDMLMLITHWLQTDCDAVNGYCEGADINHSGRVDFTDFTLLSTHWQQMY